jgi:alkanesulfonate monooxygenase SsuD/methylene tetrahydromethanopterin reductase-like flavin-dependent oxidoreductase (luciferase family)
LTPLPVQRPIPIWIGAGSEAAVKRATRLADGYLPLRPLDGGWEATMAKVRGWLAEAGRDPATFGIEGRLDAGTGTSDDWRQTIELWRGFGATHLSVSTGGLGGPDAHIQRLREVRQVTGA